MDKTEKKRIHAAVKGDSGAFAALYAALRYSRAEQDVQLLRERSIRLQEQLHRRTTHQAIRDSLAARGIDLRDPRQKTSVLEE